MDNPPFANLNELQDHHLVRLNKVQVLLKELHTELDNAQKESSLNSIIEDDKVKGLLTNLATYTSNSNKSLESSIREPISFATTAARPLPEPTKRFSTYYTQPPQKTKTLLTTPQDTKTLASPNSAHHPSRLVAQFLPMGIPENLRPDPSSIVTGINAALSANQASEHMKIVAANFNPSGNLIISTRLDQSASDLLKFKTTILPTISRINNDLGVLLREDKEWFKIQIDAVSTTSVTTGNEYIVNTPDIVHSELFACNPQYANLKDTLVSKPRWLRTLEKLNITPRSSLVFATTDEAAARHILKLKTLAAFGNYCSVKAFQDRTIRKNLNLITRPFRFLK